MSAPILAIRDLSAGYGEEPIVQGITLDIAAGEYVAIVGHPPPVPVSWSREWVLFYAAGTRPTGGYEASIESVGVSSWGPTLLVTTKTRHRRLAGPGRRLGFAGLHQRHGLR